MFWINIKTDISFLNQVKFAQGNEEFKNQQQELINSVIEKLENIKELLLV